MFDFLGDAWAPIAGAVATAGAKTMLGKGAGAAFTNNQKPAIQRVSPDKMGMAGNAQATNTAPAKVEDPAYIMNVWVNKMRMFSGKQ